MNRMHSSTAILALLFFVYLLPPTAYGQSPAPDQTATPLCSFHHLGRCALDVAGDQVGILTSPFHAKSHDLLWIVPFGAAVGTSLAYDTDALEKVGTSQSRIDFGKHVSTAGSPYVYFGASGILYIAGVASKNAHIQETGRLGGEAVIDALILTEGLKLATQRDRPFQGNGNGNFWPHGTRNYNFDSSMTSAHATVAWAFAKIVSAEYPNKPWLKLIVYGAATTVSVSRVLARDHFPSDVIVGSTFGYLTGTYVVHHHSEQYADFAVSPFIDPRERATGLAVNLPPQMAEHAFLSFTAGLGRLMKSRIALQPEAVAK
jgi:hypothetical protein